MTTQLQALIADKGPRIEVGRRAFTVEGVSSDGDIAVATLLATRAKYTAVLCPGTRIPSRPGAECWSVVTNRGTLCEFAVHEGQVLAIN